VNEKKEFYELGLRPAVKALLPQNVSDWPTTVDTELFRAQKRSGAVAYQTKLIPQWVLSKLGETIRRKLADNRVVWADKFFFTHTIRGTKHSTQHSMDAQSAELALTEYLQDAQIPEQATRQGEWWIDVAVELRSATDHCLQWRTSSHFYIVKEVLDISPEDANRITSVKSSKYARDLASHLTGVSGCRIEPGVRAQGPLEATYFQMYTTDKALTYNPEGGHHGKAITMEHAMSSTQPPAFIERLLNLYTSACENNSSNARIEVRVPFARAKTALVRLKIDTLRTSLLSFTRAEWW
jgi:hypothetical protein